LPQLNGEGGEPSAPATPGLIPRVAPLAGTLLEWERSIPKLHLKNIKIMEKQQKGMKILHIETSSVEIDYK
jgi:hypothetical protein